MSEHAREDKAAESAPVAEPAVAGPAGANGFLGGLEAPGPARVLSLQRAIGNSATTQLLQRQKTKAPAKPAAVPTVPKADGDEFKPFVPIYNVDQLFRVGADAIRTGKWRVDHIAVVAGSVYTADKKGERTGNFALKGSFMLRPGLYAIDGTGTQQFGYRKGKIVVRSIGFQNKNLPPDLRKLAEQRAKELKKQGKTGPTIYLHDFIDITEEQEKSEFGNTLLFIPEPKPVEGDKDKDKKGGGGKDGGKDGDSKQAEKEQKPPALADEGYGSEFGTSGGKRADLPRFPARIRAMSSLRGGLVAAQQQEEDSEPRVALPFVYQPVRGAATYVMEIDYTSASPNFLLGQAAAASARHYYRWELWDITESHDEAILDKAAKAAVRKPGEGSRSIGATEGASQDIDRATEELNERPAQYAEDKRRALAEKRYWDALASKINEELFGLEVGFRYGKELLGYASDAMDIGRERRVPIPTEGVFLLRCIAHYDPAADKEGRLTRQPSVATMIIKVKSREWLSRDALGDEEAQVADLELGIALTKAQIKQAKALGMDTAELEAKLARQEKELEARKGRARDLPVTMLEKELKEKEAALVKAQQESSLFKAGYGQYDDNLRRLNKELANLRHQLGHARDQMVELRKGDPNRIVHRVTGNLVSRITGQTYPMLLQLNDPKQGADGVWRCKMADSTSRRGKYYEGSGDSALTAFRKVVDALAGDDLEGYGEGFLSLRVPDAGAFAGADEKVRTYGKETRPMEWAAARKRLDELATVLGVLALVAVPGVGEVAMVLGAVMAAARIIERIHHDTLYWDEELVSDIIAILSAAASATAAVGKLRVVKDPKTGKFAICAAEEGSRIERLSKVAQRANDWFLDPANIAWGNITLLKQLKDINDQVLGGGLTATEARRQKANLMAAAINTNLALVGKVTGAMHEHNQAFEKPKPKSKGRPGGEPEGQPRRPPGEESRRRRSPAEEEQRRRQAADDERRRQAGEDEQRRRPATDEEQRRGRAPEDERGGAVLPPGTPETPPKTTPEVPARVAFRTALEGGGQSLAAEAGRLILEIRDWKGGLRRFVGELPPEHRGRAMEALAEARQKLVKEVTDEAAARFGADQRNWGTPGFGSDIDLTITPKEKLPGFRGTERPTPDQIRASADAAEFINRKLRERLGTEPDKAIDTNVYSYIAEDAVRLTTPELRARAGALEGQIGLAEARRGVDPATWAALERAISDKLSSGDPAAKQALADLKARMESGITMERAMNAELERVKGVLSQRGVPADQLGVKARDAILYDKKRRLADMFESKNPDMIKILRLQAEIRWFAPDAYASGAAFEAAVGFGQARRSAGGDAAERAGRSKPTQADILADLAANWARDRSRPEEQRMALYAAAAAAQLGMLGSHTHGSPPDQVKAAAKYAARILDVLGYSGLGGTEGRIPTALANFVRGRYPDAPERVKIQMLVQFALDTGMYGGIIRGPDGKPTGVSEAVMNRFVTEARVWAIDATARLLVGERMHRGATPDPTRAPDTPPPAAPRGGETPPPTRPPEAPPSRPPEPAGGLRGRTYELSNEYTYTDAKGVAHKAGGLERKTGAEKVSKAMARLTGLEADATPAAKAKNGLEFTLKVPEPGRSGSIDVDVAIVIKRTEGLTKSEHGEAGGPARLIPSASTDGSGRTVWKAVIEVDSRVLERDLPHVLRHEANELIGLVRAHPTGAPAGGFGPQMRAAVFVPGAAPGSHMGVKPTAHDRAAVLELKALYDDLERQKPNTPAFEARLESIERAREAMGLNETTNLRDKMRMLREAGLPLEETSQLAHRAGAELGRAHRERAAAAGHPESIFTDALAAKMLFPRELGSFRTDGLNGGHTTAHLLDFCAFSVYHVTEVTNQNAAGTTWRVFEQWKWLGPLADKPTHPDELPGGSKFDASRWLKSEQPKTTADDPVAYLREAEGAWWWWYRRHNGRGPDENHGVQSLDDVAVTGSQRAFGGPSGTENARSPGGVEFAGFHEPGSGKTTVRTIFPDVTGMTTPGGTPPAPDRPPPGPGPGPRPGTPPSGPGAAPAAQAAPDPRRAQKERVIKQIEEIRETQLQVHAEIQEAKHAKGTLAEKKEHEATAKELAQENRQRDQRIGELLKELEGLELTPYDRARAYSYSTAAGLEVAKRAASVDQATRQVVLIDEHSGRPAREPSIDHVVPVEEIAAMPRFNELTPEDVRAVLSRTDNLRVMEKAYNSSKGAKRWADWEAGRRFYGEEVWTRMVALEARLRAAIRADVEARAARRGR